MSDSRIYLAENRALQEKFGTQKLADKQETLIVHDVFTPDDIAFITARDMFFLSTVNSDAEPTISYKGGPKGFVRVIDNEIIFPSYDGNGMFLSMGNVTQNPNVGLLFIDFETPRRLRVQGAAALDHGDDKAQYPGAQFLVRVKPKHIFVNCPRYIHQYAKVGDSRYTPMQDGCSPIAEWKRLEVVHDSLSETDKAEVLKLGLLSQQDYDRKIGSNEA